jgi:hypothetical protein
MGTKRRRGRIEPTDEWEQIELLCGWPEQREYELIRPLVLFGSPAAERALETGAASERTLRSVEPPASTPRGWRASSALSTLDARSYPRRSADASST